MTTYRGKDGLVKVGGTNVVAETDNWSVNQTAATEEDTAQGDDWQTFKGGLKVFTGTIECHYDDTDATGQEAMLVGAEIAFSLFPAGDATGRQELSGSGVITSIDIASAKDAVVSRTFQFQGSGPLTIGTV